MRVIEPRKQHRTRAYRNTAQHALMAFGLVLLAGGIVGAGMAMKHHESVAELSKRSEGQVMALTIEQTAKNTPVVFSADEFKNIYWKALKTYANTQEFEQSPEVTGNTKADEAIRAVAEQRGFRMTRLPVSPLSKTGEASLEGDTDDLLQPLALQGWKDLKQAAQTANIPLQLLSAYRSPEWQRKIFTERLAGNGATAVQLAAGSGLAALDQTLSMTSIPGYSRHHTGYTVDFSCDGYTYFASSPCDKWLQKDNYLAAKTAGWIPSYPDGANDQGPEPEPWEYTWVGRDFLFK